MLSPKTVQLIYDVLREHDSQSVSKETAAAIHSRLVRERASLSNLLRTIDVMPRVGNDYQIQDSSDAVEAARGILNAAQAIKHDLQSHQRRDALRHSMQLGQSLVELQTWLLGNQS